VRDTEGAERAAKRLETGEVRSYESEYVNGLWLMQSPRLCGVNVCRVIQAGLLTVYSSA